MAENLTCARLHRLWTAKAPAFLELMTGGVQRQDNLNTISYLIIIVLSATKYQARCSEGLEDVEWEPNWIQDTEKAS